VGFVNFGMGLGITKFVRKFIIYLVFEFLEKIVFARFFINLQQN